LFIGQLDIDAVLPPVPPPRRPRSGVGNFFGRADRFLAGLAGKGNTIAHNGFRVLAGVLLAAIVLAGVTVLYHALPSTRGNETGEAEAAEREAARIKAEAETAKRETARIKADAEREAKRIKDRAAQEIADAESRAARIKADAERDAKRIKDRAAQEIADAESKARRTKPPEPRTPDSTKAARDDVFNMPFGQTSLLTVPVGDPGNAPDTAVMNDRTTGYGAVAYNYSIGKYDVTNAQYCQFLNAKAASGDPYRLWNSEMSSDPNGGIDRFGGGQFDDRTGPYKYIVKRGRENQPVVFVNWYAAIRFANWLTNAQGNGDTESGTYTITGSEPDWAVDVPDASQRAAWAAGGKKHWLLPLEDEWYKAAYYKGGGTDAGYWAYPTQSNLVPTSESPPGGSNSVNCARARTIMEHVESYLTDVGAYPNSPSGYGTFDQGGNAWQWNDVTISDAIIGPLPVLRGGSWKNVSDWLNSAHRFPNVPTLEKHAVGFRVASVP
jgi:formylglycine-generating enzyme required for sulfatase activity